LYQTFLFEREFVLCFLIRSEVLFSIRHQSRKSATSVIDQVVAASMVFQGFHLVHQQKKQTFSSKIRILHFFEFAVWIICRSGIAGHCGYL